jgi:serine/threonine protein kinase
VGIVLSALTYLHEESKVIYRDLKPENLVMDSSGYLKMVDFGFAKEMKDSDRAYTICGTPEYLAPEVILGKGDLNTHVVSVVGALCCSHWSA